MKVERQWSWWQDCCCRQTVLCEYFWLYPSSARLRRQVLTGRQRQLSTDETFSKATAVSKLLLSEINIYLFVRWKYLHISRMLLILDCMEGVLVRWGCLLTLYAGWNHASVCTEARGSSVELLSSPRPVSDAEQLHGPGVCSTHSDIPRLWRGTTNYGAQNRYSSSLLTRGLYLFNLGLGFVKISTYTYTQYLNTQV